MTNSKFKRKIYSTQNLDIEGLRFILQRKKVRRLTLKINNKNGDLEIVAPINLSEKTIIDFVNSKKLWIVKNQQRILKKIESQNTDFIEGKSIRIFGEEYQLKFDFYSRKPQVKLINNEIIINNSYQEQLYNKQHNFILIDSLVVLNKEQKLKIIEKFYREELRKIIEILTPKWQEILKVKANFIGIKKMRTRHGSCNARSKRIWLSLNLIQYPIEFIEYVLVHEFVHFFVQNHGKKFYALMDKFLPKWKEIRKKNLL